MAKFSQKSKSRLAECHPDLQRVLNEVVKGFDCTILTGRRGQADQNEMFATGRSKVRYPNSKHNANPSNAVDVAPYPIDWTDRERFHYFAGYVMGVASNMGVRLRWGGDWDSDREVRDNSFDDLVHFERVV